MWCRVLFQTYFYVFWIFYTEETSAEKQLMSGEVQDRYKRDVDILVECDVDCVADEEVGEYDVLLEYDLEESYQARRPYSSTYMDYGHFGTPRKCSYPCKILKLTKTGDVNGNVENQIVSIEEVDKDSIDEIINEGLNTTNSNVLPSLGDLNNLTVSERNMKIDGLSSETPIHLKEALEVRIFVPIVSNNATATAVFNSSDTVLNLTDTLNLNASEQLMNLTETPKTITSEQVMNLNETRNAITSEQVLTTSTTTKPIIMVPKIIRLTVLEAEMVEASSLKRPPTVKTPLANFIYRFFHPANSSSKTSLNYENATEQSQIKYDDVTKFDVINTTYSSVYNVNASITHTVNGSSCNISLKGENTTRQHLLKDEAATTPRTIGTTYDFLQKYSNSVKKVLTEDAGNNASSTEKIAQTTNSINKKRNSTVSLSAISSVAMNELNPSLYSYVENNATTTTENVGLSLETEGIYTEESHTNDIDIVVSKTATDNETPILLEEVTETKSNYFSSNTTIPTTHMFSKTSTHDIGTVSNVNSTIGSLDTQNATSLNMDENVTENTNINISLDEFSNMTDGNTLSADYIELLKSLIVEESENATDSSYIYSSPSTVYIKTEGTSFENTTDDSNYDFAFSGNFTANDSSFPKEFHKSLVEKLKQHDTGANVAIVPQHHSSNKTAGITTLRKVGSGQTKKETSR